MKSGDPCLKCLQNLLVVFKQQYFSCANWPSEWRKSAL